MWEWPDPSFGSVTVIVGSVTVAVVTVALPVLVEVWLKEPDGVVLPVLPAVPEKVAPVVLSYLCVCELTLPLWLWALPVKDGADADAVIPAVLVPVLPAAPVNEGVDEVAFISGDALPVVPALPAKLTAVVF